jgi:predicted xylose isomerase-like sugar epimerase
MKYLISLAILFSFSLSSAADWQRTISDRTELANSRVVQMRHDFHTHPELGNREFKSAEKTGLAFASKVTTRRVRFSDSMFFRHLLLSPLARLTVVIQATLSPNKLR